MTAEIRISVADGVATICIDRPAFRNALNRHHVRKIHEAVVAADSAPDTRAIVLTSAHEGYFSSGYDLGDVPDRLTAEDVIELHAPVRQLTAAMTAARAPVIAVVRGFAYGAAVDIVAHADLRVAEIGTKYALPASRLGFSYVAEGIQRIVAVMGLSRAQSLLLHARTFEVSSDTGEGLFQYAFPTESFCDDVSALIADIASRAPLAVAGMKGALAMLCGKHSATPHEIEAYYTIMTACMASDDAREGRLALSEKRKPRFSGR